MVFSARSGRDPSALLGMTDKMKLALIHDYLTEYGGAERVLEALHELWPDSPVYTAFANINGLGPHAERFRSWDIRSSWARHLPFVDQLKSGYRIFAPMIWENINFDAYDVVISITSSYFSKAILTKPETLHICYMLTPPRFLWGLPTARDWEAHWWSKAYGVLTNHFLRQYDVVVSQRPDYIIAISDTVAHRIHKHYKRDATVIYPPVDTTALAEPPFARRDEQAPYFLVVSRLARAKHVDIAVRACQKAGVKLKVVGQGSQERRLRSMGGAFVEFLGEISDARLRALYQQCEAVIFPAEDEDFGIVPVEAMASGKPVIAYKSGAVTETVIDGKTGILVAELSVDAFAAAIEQFQKKKLSLRRGQPFNPAVLQRTARTFSKDRFQKKIRDLVNFPNAVLSS